MPRLLLLTVACLAGRCAFGAPPHPYARQVAAKLSDLKATDTGTRVRAAEALGYLRAYGAEGKLVDRLRDGEVAVRREAALALAWCGGRAAVPPLLKALDDRDWSVAQGAWVALTNITGMELPFDALAAPAKRKAEVEAWRTWWDAVPAGRPPKDVLALLGNSRPGGLAHGCPVTASTTYKGPPSVLTDGATGPAYFQTKQVPFPQWVQVDLMRPTTVAQVVVHQYGPRFCMTDYVPRGVGALSRRWLGGERAPHRVGRTPSTLGLGDAL